MNEVNELCRRHVVKSLWDIDTAGPLQQAYSWKVALPRAGYKAPSLALVHMVNALVQREHH